MKKNPRALIFPSEQIRRTSLQVRLSEASLGSHNSQKLSKPIWYGVWKSIDLRPKQFEHSHHFSLDY